MLPLIVVVAPILVMMISLDLALVVMMIFRPKGLFGSYDFSMSRVLEKALNFVFRPELRKGKEEADNEQN